MYNKGYRNGFMRVQIPISAFNTVAPEYLNSYEASYRSEWLHKTLTLNGNVFYYDYTNQQVAFDEEIDFTGTGTGLGFPMSYILNAESSHAYGAEIEARWRPISPLQLYALARSDAYGVRRVRFGPTGILSGNEMPDAPAYT